MYMYLDSEIDGDDATSVTADAIPEESSVTESLKLIFEQE